MHDRMSTSRGTGQGCWASNATLATKCGINYTNLSTVVTDLARWGYLIRESHPLNKRLRIYRVIYEVEEERETVWVLTIRHGARQKLKPSDLV